MRIQFERAGGLAAPAMRRSCTVEKSSLPPAEAAELQELVNTAHIANLAVSRNASPLQARPDMFHYRVTLEINGQTHTVMFSDADMPESIRPLVQWLTRRASAGIT